MILIPHNLFHLLAQLIKIEGFKNTTISSMFEHSIDIISLAARRNLSSLLQLFRPDHIVNKLTSLKVSGRSVKPFTQICYLRKITKNYAKGSILPTLSLVKTV